MIFHAADDERLAIVVCEDSAHVAVQFFAHSLAAQKWPPILGGENRVHQNLPE